MSQQHTNNDGGQREGRLKVTRTHPNKDPDWTRGLKRLYDSVLAEPMPDSFKDLLSKLDEPDDQQDK